MVHGKTPNCGRWDFFRHFRHVCLFFELRRRSYSANHPLSKAAQWLWIRLPRSRTRSSPLNPKSKRMTTRIGWSFFLVRQMGLLCGGGYRRLPLALRAAIHFASLRYSGRSRASRAYHRTRLPQSRFTAKSRTAAFCGHSIKSRPNQKSKKRTIRKGWFFSLVRQMGLEPIRLRTRTSNVPVCQFQHCRARCIIRCGFRIVNYYFALFRCFLNVRVRNS